LPGTNTLAYLALSSAMKKFFYNIDTWFMIIIKVLPDIIANDISEHESKRSEWLQEKKNHLQERNSAFFESDSFTFFQLFHVDPVSDKKAEHFQ